MLSSEITRAVAAARSTATSVGLTVDDASVLHNSNRIAVRLMPCEVLARVAPPQHRAGQFEIDLAGALAAASCPVGLLDPRVEPRVHERDGFMITFWSYYRTEAVPQVSAPDYADALRRLHAGMRTVDVAAPHFTDRVASAQQLIEDPELTPDLGDADRELLDHTLRSLGAAVDERGGAQLLHGEPHPGNLLPTPSGLLFIDLETCCRGPVEFDVAHAPDEVAEHYPGIDHDLLRQCRHLMLAMIISWRWDRRDQLPNGRRLAAEWTADLRAELLPGQ